MHLNGSNYLESVEHDFRSYNTALNREFYCFSVVQRLVSLKDQCTTIRAWFVFFPVRCMCSYAFRHEHICMVMKLDTFLGASRPFEKNWAGHQQTAEIIEGGATFERLENYLLPT